ncbi:putative abieta-7,13-dien-18-ol hydroxylase [Helianthus annuus]|nr:putative abieta-7,13-dien-18-ol hydroxylase [Helianthus annuus]
MSNDHRPPVVGSTLTMLVHIDDLFDYIALIAKKHRTFCFVTPTHSEIYVTDPICVEHILKSSFQNYTKGHNKLIMGSLQDLLMRPETYFRFHFQSGIWV